MAGSTLFKKASPEKNKSGGEPANEFCIKAFFSQMALADEAEQGRLLELHDRSFILQINEYIEIHPHFFMDVTQGFDVPENKASAYAKAKAHADVNLAMFQLKVYLEISKAEYPSAHEPTDAQDFLAHYEKYVNYASTLNFNRWVDDFKAWSNELKSEQATLGSPMTA